MAEAQSSNAVDSIFGTLDRLGSFWIADRNSKREDRIAARNAQREVFAGTSARTTKREPIPPQTIAAYAAVTMAVIAVLGLTLRFFAGRRG